MHHLDKLLYLHGISSEFYDYSGQHRDVPHNLRLDALIDSGGQASPDSEITHQIEELDTHLWTYWLRQQQICTLNSQGCFLEVRMHPEELNQQCQWQCETEFGEKYAGLFTPSSLEEIGEYYIDDVRYSARRLCLPALSLGYHQVTLTQGDKQQSGELIVTPKTCHQIPEKKGHRKLFGISCQLYTLRSETNWGIGDFSDLKELVKRSAAQGLDLIGLNPLHAPDFNAVEFASPYSPSDRRFLNPLYIDPEQVTEYAFIDEGKYAKNPEIAHQLETLRASPMVEYEQVAAIKFSIFETLFHTFSETQHTNPERAKAFETYLSEHSPSLIDFAKHESNQYQLKGLNENSVRKNWQFYAYLQFVASQQLDACQTLAKQLGMAIGLKGDLAVGSMESGAEVQTNRALYARTAKAGAPPDQFSTTGQNWDLPVWNPVQLRKTGFQHYINLLRCNMRHFGALRIDHAMALMRLWWCFEGNRGLYVYYPLDDMLALLRLESVRHQCMVIGEDMGVVPPMMREKMSDSGMYGNRLLYFYCDSDTNDFVPPDHHRSDVLFMVTNHDVPTLAGWWSALDIQLREKFVAINHDEACALLKERRDDKQRLLSMLENQTTHDSNTSGIEETLLDMPLSIELCHKLLLFCAQSQADLLLIQLEDLSLIETPVNIPGTYREYPNWRRKQKSTLMALFSEEANRALLSKMQSLRPSYSPRLHFSLVNDQ